MILKKARQFFLTRDGLHCLKATIAYALAIITMHLLAIPRSQWILITVVTVMTSQIYPGSVLTKSAIRTAGTLIGSLISILTILIFPQYSPIYGIVVIVCGFVLTYIAIKPGEIAYMGRLGIITMAIILFTPHPDLQIALYRTTEVLIGIVIGLAVSLLIFPLFATHDLQAIYAKNFERLERLFQLSVIEGRSRLSDQNTAMVDKAIYNSFPKKRSLIQISHLEKKSTRINKEKLFRLIDFQRDLYRGIHMIKHISVTNKPLFEQIKSLPEYQAFTKDMLKISSVTTSYDIINDLKAHQNVLITRLLKENTSQQNLSSIYTMQFIMEQFCRRLQMYHNLYQEIFIS